MLTGDTSLGRFDLVSTPHGDVGASDDDSGALIRGDHAVRDYV